MGKRAEPTTHDETIQPDDVAIKTDLAIDKDDLVAIRVAEVEQQLHQERNACIAKKRAAEKQAEVLRASYRNTVTEAAEHAFSETVKPLLDALDTAGVAVSGKKRVVSYSGHVADDNQRSTLSVTIEGIAQPLTRNMPNDVRRELNDIQDDIDAAVREASACDEEMVDIKRRLNDIPMLERQAKAALAKAVISGGVNGKTLLSVISRANLLPAPKG